MSGGITCSFENRIALITGASRGIGAAIARRLGAEGVKPILLARTVGGLEETDDAIRQAGGEQAVLVPHDLRDHDAIDRLGASLYERFGRLDLLIGCAAELGPLSPVGHIRPENWQGVFDVNVTANYRLLRSLDPLLRRSEAARVVFLTDRITEARTAYWAAYAASKAALEVLAACYAGEVANTGIRVNLVRPGPTRTAFRAQAFPGEDTTNLPSPDSRAESIVKSLAENDLPHGECLDISP
jgi:NAD(P)-dependent dehydrogenase (short-subunit alcohol dehydrogenase family)